jgi:uncharacterized protein YfaP (DUF2135 family)
MNGLKIEVPQTATEDPVQFEVSYSDVSSLTGLPDNCEVAGEMISIETSGSSSFNQYKMFERPVTVTLPYTPSEDHSSIVRYYWYDPSTGTLDSAGFLTEDNTAHTETFTTASFSDFIAIRTFLNFTGETLGLNAAVDTNFRPARDGWFIPNMGSYLGYENVSTNGGYCLGMVSFAKWYYSNIATGFHAKYHEGSPTEWRDDATAIQLAARAHIATAGIWNSLNAEELNAANTYWQTADARQVALSIISGMIVTGEPQLIGLRCWQADNTWRAGGHAIMAYAYSNGNFEIYDPNYPGSQPGETMRQIPFNYADGFDRAYVSSTNANDPAMTFNVFYHAGSKLASTPSDYRGLYDSAERGFQGNNLFPVITLTDTTTTPEGTTPVDTDSDGTRDTIEPTATISGEITNQNGNYGLSEVQICVDNVIYTAPLSYSDQQHAMFSRQVPLMDGVNDVIILATDGDTFSNWAGFVRAPIYCSASPAAMTVTLTWDQDQSDVDLHVSEPGSSGRHIYYSDKGGGDNSPYLDIDNREGFGPEHYYATEGMIIPGQTNLYGTYQIRVNYYADHDANTEQDQTITWHLTVKYLAYKNTATGQEYWEEDYRSGTLSTANPSGTSNFQNSGAGWSSTWTINYPAPDPENFGVTAPPQNVFKWSP